MSSNARNCCLALTIAVLAWSTATPVLAQNPITYQGQLRDAGEPFTGLATLEFSLYDSLVGGSQVAGPVELPDVPVEDGLFQVALDFGPGAFAGGERFLQVSVDATPLAPRQRITAAPSSLRAGFAEDGNWPFRFDNGNAVFSGGDVGIGTNAPEQPLDVVGSARFGRAGNGISSANAFVTGGAGSSFNHATGQQSFVGGGFSNSATNRNAFVAGGAANEASGVNAFVGGGANNVASGDNSLAAGFGAEALHANSFVWSDGDVLQTTAAGQFVIGAASGVGINAIPDADLHVRGRAIFGRAGNNADGLNAFVTGGAGTTLPNRATGRASAVVGGEGNEATASRAVVLGGIGNAADGANSVAAGTGSRATANTSFALGDDAIAAHAESFVWSGSGFGTPFQSTDPFQYLIRADGGVGINTNNPESQLHVLGPSPDADPFGQLRLEGSESSGAAGTGAGISFLGNDGNGIRRIWGHIENVKENSTAGSLRARMSFYTRGPTGLPQRRMNINSNGAVGVNTSSNLSLFHVRQTSDDGGGGITIQRAAPSTNHWELFVSAGDTFVLEYNDATAAVIETNGEYFQISDARRKRGIRPMDGVLERFLRLEPSRYTMVGSEVESVGLIAQQVRTLFPELVTEVDGDGDGLLAVSYDQLSVVAVQAMIELTERLEATATRNAELEARLAALEARLAGSRVIEGERR